MIRWHYNFTIVDEIETII